MKITSVEVSDFLTIKQAKFQLNDQGLVAVAGVNGVDSSASSNGAGKSSLGDAVCFGIWGTTARDESGDDIIRTGAKKANVSIILHDEATGESFAISRSRAKGKGTTKLSKVDASGPVDLTGGTEKLTQEAIRKIMGCSEEVFRSAVYLGQDNLPNLPALTDKKLKEIVEEAAGVEVLNAAYAEAQARLRALQHQIAPAEANVATCRLKLKAAEDRVVEFEGYRDAQEVQRKKFIDRTNQAAERHKAQKAEMDERRAKMPTIDALLGMEKATIDALAATDAERQKRDELQREASSLRGLLLGKQSEQAVAEQRLASARADLTNIANRIGKPCVSCGTTITPETLGHATKHAEEMVEKSNAIYDAVLAQVAYAQQEADKASKALDDYVMTDVSSLHDRLSKVRALLQGVRQLERDIESKALAVRAELESAHEMEKAANPWIDRIEDQKKAVGLEETRLRNREAHLDELQAQMGVVSAVVEVFGPAGVRAHILDQVTPFLNERTAEYLATMTDGKIAAVWTTLVRNSKGELREKFSIEVTHAEHGKGYKSISGGEKRRVRLACAFALQDLVATRANKPIHLMITDEVDDALDMPGLERLMAVMTQKAKERGTVMVISHNDLKSWIGNCWTVTKTSDGSVLTND